MFAATILLFVALAINYKSLRDQCVQYKFPYNGIAHRSIFDPYC